jgi:hypothetical protein
MNGVMKKSDLSTYALLASTETHYQILVPCNYNHTFHVAEWVNKKDFTPVEPSQSGSFFSYKVEGVLETVCEKLDQQHLK